MQGGDDVDASKDENTPNNFMDEVDELLLEQDLLSPTTSHNALKNLSHKGKLSSGKKQDSVESPTVA